MHYPFKKFPESFLNYRTHQFTEKMLNCRIRSDSINFKEFFPDCTLTEGDYEKLNEIRQSYGEDPWLSKNRKTIMGDLSIMTPVKFECGIIFLKTEKDLFLPYILHDRVMYCSMLGLYTLAFRMYHQHRRAGLERLKKMLSIDTESMLHSNGVTGPIIMVFAAISRVLSSKVKVVLKTDVPGLYDINKKFWFGTDKEGNFFGYNTDVTSLCAYNFNVTLDDLKHEESKRITMKTNEMAHLYYLQVISESERQYQVFEAKLVKETVVEHKKQNVQMIGVPTAFEIQYQMMELLNLEEFVDRYATYGKYRKYSIMLDSEYYEIPNEIYRQTPVARGNSKKEKDPLVQINGPFNRIYPVCLTEDFRSIVEDIELQMYYKHRIFQGSNYPMVLQIMPLQKRVPKVIEYPSVVFQKIKKNKNDAIVVKLGFLIYNKDLKLTKVVISDHPIQWFRTKVKQELNSTVNCRKRKKESFVVYTENDSYNDNNRAKRRKKTSVT